MLLAGELLRIQPQDAHGVHRRVRKGPVPAAGSLAHDSRQTPPPLFRRLYHTDGALADDALKRGGVAAGRLRPLKPVAGVQLEPGPAELIFRVVEEMREVLPLICISVSRQ